MKAELLPWLAESLGLPLVEEMEGGAIRANAVANKRLGEEKPTRLGDAIERISGEALVSATLKATLDQARAGNPAEYKAEGGDQILVMPAGEGRACAVVVPAELNRAAPGLAVESKPNLTAWAPRFQVNVSLY